MIYSPTVGFTLRDYENLLKKTQENYRFVGFEILDDESIEELPERVAIIRHDIDMSPEYSLAMAEIESKNKVRSTYTILLNGEFYNPFERHNRSLFQEIASLGHDIGLHFDPVWHDISSEDQLESAIYSEKSILNQIINSNRLAKKVDVKMFSFHNTTTFSMQCKKRFYAGLRNAYAGVLQDQVSYISDSNGYWIYRSWHDLLEESPSRVQVLTHPEWWNENDAEPGEKVCRHLEFSSQRIWNSYNSSLVASGRNNKIGLVHGNHLQSSLGLRNELDQLLQLWLSGRRELAFIQLFRHFDHMANEILKRYLKLYLLMSSQSVNALLSDTSLRLDSIVALTVCTSQTVIELIGCSGAQYTDLVKTRNDLIHRRLTLSKIKLQDKFDCLSRLMGNLMALQKKYFARNTTSIKLTYLQTDETAFKDWLMLNAKDLGLDHLEIMAFLSRHPKIFAHKA